METVIIRGGGDLGTGIAYKLYKSGYKVIILEINNPLAVRRTVAFSEAVYENEVTVEGVRGIFVKDKNGIYEILNSGTIPIFIDSEGDIIRDIKPLAVIDAIIAKKNLGTKKSMAPITIGIGPGFEAGKVVDLAIESNRGPNLGKIFYSGKPLEDTGIPSSVMGYAEERVLRAPIDGIVTPFYKIGDTINEGEVICKVGEEDLKAPFTGLLRGMIKEGLYVKKGLKIGDIDPRCINEYAYTISDKAKTIGDSVVKGIEELKTTLIERD